MTFALISLAALAFIGHIWISDRAHKRATNAHTSTVSAHRLELMGLIERLERKDREHREEIQTLCQRIQAPEVAVLQHQVETAGEAGMQVPLNDIESAKREEWEHLQREINRLEAAEAAA